VLAASPKDLEDASLFTFPQTASLRQLQLAVLSACSTGRGQVTSPEAIMRPFLMAGVPQVVGSYWKIDSEASAEFVSTMYEQFLSQKTASEALRTAAIKIQQRQVWSHPYYWAPFFNVGRG
jgi:CHAT domain-containing protein